jgi:menaquinone-dependent protoporphyrinogen oxidase
MSAPILVAHATRYGSTQEVAEAIAATLRDDALAVDLQPVRMVRSLGGYSAVVLGAPLYMFHWHRDARRFLLQHREALMQLPIAIFALGPLSTNEQEIQGSRNQLDKELVKYPWLTPVALEIFGGKYDPSKLSLFHKVLAALPASPLHGLPARDIRDWAAIRTWASSMAVQLQPAVLHEV